MSVRGSCTYSYNPTERYQHPEWGSECGRVTFAGYEEVEVPRLIEGNVIIEKKLVERDQPDPWCPAHGGTPDPTPPANDIADDNVPADNVTTLKVE
jgi:hypothetical protein